ncbi:MAG TPA: CorA family divalent cation transporter [Rhizomicrobium sp.]|jgi:zinc transporter|nr:CorA family divalent cation transporter [Rhizomicrobium sp.]
MLQTLKKNPGLLWGLAVREGRAERMIDDTAAEILAAPHDWCWMHFALSDHRARRFIESFDAAPPEARELLLENETRPQLHLAPGAAYGVIPDFEKDFEEHDYGEGSVAFYLDAGHLITTRHHPMRVVDEVREEVQAEPPAQPVDVFVRLNERFVEIAEKRFAVFSRWLDRLEDRVLGEQGDLDKTGLGSVRREVARFHREFASLRASYHRAMNLRTVPDNPVSPRLPELLQAAEDFDRDASGLSERARLLYEEIDTRIASRTNRSLRTLTVISTLLLPPTFVVGAFGMNLPHIPWAATPGGFWWAMGLCAVVVGGCWTVLKRYDVL